MLEYNYPAIPSNNVKLGAGDLTVDVWGSPKVSLPISLFHGLWTFDIPASMWFMFHGATQVYSSTNIVSSGGVATLTSDATTSVVRLESRECPRYQPNRGHLYSDAGWITNKANGDVKHGLITFDSSGAIENGVFFWHKPDGKVYATIVSGGTTYVSEEIDTSTLTGYDSEKSNIYDIQFQWRSAGNYHFYIGNPATGVQELVKSILFLGTLTRASIVNPALPASAWVSYTSGTSVTWNWGCADITSENGIVNTEQYGSAYAEAVATTTNTPIMVIKQPLTIGSATNTRTVTLARITATCSKKAVFKVWITRNPSDITGATYQPIGTGTFVETDSPDMVAGAVKATSVTLANLKFITAIPVEATASRSVDNPYRGKIEFPLVRGDYLIITGTASGGSSEVVVEFGEQI